MTSWIEAFEPFLTRAFVEDRNMTAQEILEGICRHRANMIARDPSTDIIQDVKRKFDECEWALQAMAEKQVELEDKLSQLSAALANNGA